MYTFFFVKRIAQSWKNFTTSSRDGEILYGSVGRVRRAKEGFVENNIRVLKYFPNMVTLVLRRASKDRTEQSDNIRMERGGYGVWD